MMQVWGKVTRLGCKIINPDSDKPYLRFYLYVPYRLKSNTVISVNWWDWDWEPAPGTFVRATGWFEVNETPQKAFMNLYIWGNVASPDEWAPVPGVKAQKAPDWRGLPNYDYPDKSGSRH